MIRFNCPQCQKTLRAPDDRADRAFRCPACGNPATITDAQAELPSPEQESKNDRSGTAPPRRRVEEGRPKDRGPGDRDADAVHQKPRRRRRRLRRDRDGGAGFSIVDSIPLGYSLQITIGAGLGFLLQTVGTVLFRRAGVPLSIIGALLVSLGALFWLWGCAAYAKNKGYPELVGAVGLIGCLGLIILIVLPDRSGG